MTVVFTVPQTTVPTGPGSFTSNTIASGTTQLKAVLTQVGWPFVGGTAITYTLDYSNDNGTNWKVLSTGNISDTSGNVTFGCSLPNSGITSRKVRLSYNFAKSLTISGTIEVL